MTTRPTFSAIRELLGTVGPMTSREASTFFPGDPFNHVAACLSKMRRAKKKHVHVTAWVQIAVGNGGTRPVPLYDVGDKRDAPKPAPMTKARTARRYREKKKTAARVAAVAPTSVFDLARFL